MEQFWLSSLEYLKALLKFNLTSIIDVLIVAFVIYRPGALIVLERDTGLEEHVDTGVKIDGIVSAEFLVNLFIPKTPLHDGAVIIRGGRVVAAACFLPLSENPNLTSELGTRHRAGIGITEISDAVAVIVSEETGIVSVAVEGAITRDLDEAGLQDRLTGLLSNRTANTISSLWFRRE
ncbi:MAG: hypothetical protein XD97_0075 [Pelotomaculum thermopropionicum]|uniref:DAC domain-containing protein n=1 Tax=Pelotomaculum thermopropionicum TaxID=110500 RepID=A0A101HVJ2_9FIRM|nr:MAG: hypothetical protein XD97_0075 [Pelotomaculum thermopropionicum]